MKHSIACVLIACLCLVACTPPRSPAARTQAVPTSMPEIEQSAAANAIGGGAAYGQVLFFTMQPKAGFACATCHYPDSNNRLIGPGLRNLRERVTEYGLDESVESYLLRAILDPEDFITPADPPFASNLMPKNYGEIFSDAELNDLIAYLLTL